MAYESSDYDHIRERVEKRLAPLKKLRRLRFFLFLNLALFAGFLFLQGYHPGNSILVNVIPQSGSWFNEVTRQTETWTAVSYETYPLVILIAVVWFFLLIAHAIHVWSSYRHERAIQRETDREMNLEMERLRLRAELARSERPRYADGEESAPEKAKRALQLGDDGELLSEEEPRVMRRRRS